MPFEIVLPRLGWNMETGRLGEWLKRDGEHVEAGEILFTVEGDKATQEVEALDSGILRIPPDAPPPGEEVPVGTVLGYLLAPGEEIADQQISESAIKRFGDSANERIGDRTDQGANQSAIRNPQSAPTISPRARRVAGELGVDWSGLTGSGRTGRIVERDVRQAAAAAQAIPPTLPPTTLAPTLPSAPSIPAGTPIPITTMRRTIAERMATSAHTVAPVTLTTEADATELVRLRKQLKEDGRQPLPSYNDLLAKLVAQALLEHPMVNARFDGDTIVQVATANIGIAVDTERGLLVPVVRDVQTKSLRQFAGEWATLIEKTRTGRISLDDLSGGTFTITNLGMYEIDAFTPIINLPECAILGVGRIVAKQVVVDAAAERVAIRHMMFLSLTFDHRLVDGAPAARFLQRVKEYVEKPYLWLVG